MSRSVVHLGHPFYLTSGTEGTERDVEKVLRD